MGSGSWEEMVQGAVGNSAYLKEQLIDLLASYNEVMEAARWAILYNLEDSLLPESVITAKEELKRYSKLIKHTSKMPISIITPFEEGPQCISQSN